MKESGILGPVNIKNTNVRQAGKSTLPEAK